MSTPIVKTPFHLLTIAEKNSLLLKTASDGQTDKVLRLLKHVEIDPNCCDTNNFTPINCAAWFDRIETVHALLEDVRVDPTKAGNIGEFPLFCAVQRRNLDVIKTLAWHPRVKINQRKNDGGTAFLFAAQEGHEDEMKVLLEVPGIDVNLSLNNGASPLFLACQNGHLGAVKLLLALGNNVHVGTNWGGRTPAQHVRQKEYHEIADLLEAYEKDRGRVAWDLRREFKIPEAIAADLFATIVLLCDGLLETRNDLQLTPEEVSILRFLKIACALPMEIQMVLSNRTLNLTHDIVGANNREAAFFRVLARFQVVPVQEKA